ncbi:MAG: hypothetical protein OIN66_09820 [Candidatus Methanoperedens sp.]|nr:hypothetical protein [Candidatus Methanoperedens sp.]
MDRAEEIKLQYKRLRSEYGELYDEVLQILFRNDPIGINFEINTDEYEPEVSTILPRLIEAHSVEDLQKIIHQEFIRWFSADIAGSRAKYARIAQEVWGAYKKHAV